MRMPRILVVIALLTTACAGPDRAEAALLSLDREAREAGIQLEVSGERLTPELPVAVDPSEEAWVVRPDARERLIASPGEWIEVGADGTAHRQPIDPDHFVATGDAASAAALADLLGADVDPMGGNRWSFHAPSVVWVAALFARDEHAASGMATSAFTSTLAGGDAAWQTRGASLDSASVVRSSDVPDLASLVGVYRHADIVLVVDASGGYSLVTSTRHTRGTFGAIPGGTRFTSDDGEISDLVLNGETLTDGETLALAPAVEVP